jgi:uncharacterized membrane protein YiaA
MQSSEDKSKTAFSLFCLAALLTAVATLMAKLMGSPHLAPADRMFCKVFAFVCLLGAAGCFAALVTTVVSMFRGK